MNSTRNYLKIRKYFELNDKKKKKKNYTSNIRLLDSGSRVCFMINHCTARHLEDTFCLCANFHNKEFHFVLLKKKKKHKGLPWWSRG